MSESSKFSTRFGFRESKEVEIKVRYEAPYELRGVLIELAYESGLRPKQLRDITCKVLRKRPDSNNWSDKPVTEEISKHIDDAQWYKIYDLVEAIAQKLAEPEKFENELNTYLLEEGIGWKLVDCQLEARNPEALELSIQLATEVLEESGKETARGQLQEALTDLSRRPKADITGSIQHSMTALECVFRDVSGDNKATLGELLKRYPDMVPAPLDKSIEKLWGFASEYGRHMREGRDPEFSEAQLVVGICAALITYLISKTKE